MVDVIVGIPTFRRPASLARLLVSLEPSLRETGSVRVVIADNACEAETRSVVERFAERFPDTVYLPVTQRGISQNRNAMIEHFIAAEGAPRWLGFLDDDLVAPANWLGAMLASARANDADAVGGPYHMATPAKSFVVSQSILVRRPRYASGAIDVFYAGGNCLLSRRLLETAPPLRFDPAFGLSGGEDYDFFSRAKVRGACFFWCDEALCLEEVPTIRQTKGYVFHRYYSTGCSMSLVDLKTRSLGAITRSLLRTGCGGIAKTAYGALCFNRRAALDGVFSFLWALGGLSGVLGFAKVERYK